MEVNFILFVSMIIALSASGAYINHLQRTIKKLKKEIKDRINNSYPG